MLTCKRSLAERSHEVKGVKKTGKERKKYREREREGGGERESLFRNYGLSMNTYSVCIYIYSSLCISLNL